MIKKVFIFISIIVLLGGIGYTYLFLLKRSEPTNNALNAIPRNAALIIELNEAKKVYDKLSETNIMWEELMTVDCFNQLNYQMSQIDSAVQNNNLLDDLLEENPLYASIHSTGDKKYEFLFTFNLGLKINLLSLETILDDNGFSKNQLSTKNYNGTVINTIALSPKPFSFTIVDGLFIGSYSIVLVEDAVKHTRTGNSIKDNILFKKIHKTAGKKTDANIYLNFKYFFKLFDSYLDSKSYKNILTLSSFAEWSESDVRIRPNSITMNGFTTFNDSLDSYLNLFKGQTQQEIKFTHIIPSSTSSFIFIGMSNFDKFYSKYKSYLKRKERLNYHTNVINAINSLYELDIEKSLLSWIGNEIALVYTEPKNSNLTRNTYAVFKSKNVEQVNNSLDSLVSSLSSYHSKKVETETYRDFNIVNINIPYIIPNLLGGLFQGLDQSYFIIIDEYVVFGNSNSGLKEFINRYLSEKTLSRDINYINFAEKLSSESNIYLYSNIARSSNIYKAFLNPSSSNQITEQIDLLQKFGAVGYQINGTDIKNSFYNNIYLDYNPVYKQVSASMWETELDTCIRTKPSIVINHYTSNKEIVVQDVLNSIYLISPTGKVLFKKTLDDEIIGSISQIDLYKNGKLQMLFNTTSAIHLLDRKGNYVDGYPIKLKANATNPVAIIDYDNKRDYRLIVACEDKHIYNYTGEGKLVRGWKFKKSESIIKAQIKHFSIKKKDYVVAVDSLGKVYVLNRQGQTRIKMKKSTNVNSQEITIEIGKDINSTKIISTDTLGTISKLYLSSKEEIILIDTVSSNHFFLYKDINNDKIAEYIYLDQSILSVYDHEGALVYSYTFNTEISDTPLLFNFGSKGVKIGILAEQSNEVFLFNPDGTMAEGFPLTGSKKFSISDINRNGSLNLITGDESRNIYTFSLE
ncbi:MAG: DUF3352 domain-containing protein [Flavobacteriales bacterium]|nr:DUF3352 domain-containing protein [Flavobacteriales bacterium]